MGIKLLFSVLLQFNNFQCTESKNASFRQSSNLNLNDLIYLRGGGCVHLSRYPPFHTLSTRKDADFRKGTTELVGE